MRASSGMRRLLLPFNPVYRLAAAVREMSLRRGWRPVRRLRFPVISVGNLSTGGAGKTPFAIALATGLAGRGFAVDVLSRGYGRKSESATRVELEGSPETFGDEPLVIARETDLPVYVAPERYDAGLLAEAGLGADPDRARIHILDDGFQHRQLHRDIDILLLNRDDWHDRLLPAGNLREPLKAVRRAHVIAIPEAEAELERELRSWGWDGPVWRMHRSMEVPRADGPVVAFCGIARPEQFFAGLEAAGLRLAARITFPDHHPYTGRDLERLQSVARSSRATLITTGKDQVRLAAIAPLPPRDLPVLTAGLRIDIQDQGAAIDWLAGRLRGTAADPSL